MKRDLPPEWIRAELQSLGEVRLGRQRSPSRAVGPHMRPYMRAANVTWSGIDLTDVKEMDFSPEEAPVFELRDGDILIGEASGSRLEVGKSAVWRGEIPGACFQNTLIRLRLREGIDPDFVQKHLLHDARRGALAEISKGIGIHHLSAGSFSKWEIGFPSLEVQRRIVARIEELTGHSRRAREALEAVSPLLEKLRQSVLAAAFSGRLTAAWRAAHSDVEPASVLLERIRAERRRRWEEAELAKMRAKGREPKDDGWKGRYREPVAVDPTGLPELPEGWCWASVEELSTKVVDGVHKKPEYLPDGVPFITVKNLTAGPGISFAETNFVSEADHSEFCRRTDPQRGDILVSKDGTLGVVRLVDTDRAFSIFVSVALVKPCLSEISSYVCACLSAPLVQRLMRATGSGLQHIHLCDLRSVPIPLAPLQEQAEISRVVGNFDLLAHSFEGAQNLADERLPVLDRSILSSVFNGRTLPRYLDDRAGSVAPEASCTNCADERPDRKSPFLTAPEK